MLTVKVFNQKAEPTGTVDLDESIFKSEVRDHLFHEVVRMQLARRRGANPQTKSRSEVSGGGRKPYRQKGTGRARQGSTRAPHFRGGGVVFGPNGRKYVLSLPKKVRREALKSALSLRAGQQRLLVVDAISLPSFKTKSFVDILKAFNLSSALFIMGEQSLHVQMSARNIPEVKVLLAEGLNVYDILRHESLVVTLSAVQKIQERLQ